ncbi:MAG: precorrin-8X methylmutase [Clostridia bacterium]|nr:precorrin-8X methylmutase [Clostridia bacterium]
MLIELLNVLPSEIEKRSFEIIESELPREIDAEIKPIVKRVIHTTADFDYVENLCFSDGVVQILKDAIKNGADIVTDTQMAKSGINKKRLASFGGEVYCFMSDEDVAAAAKENGTTRAAASMEKAARLGKDVIFAIGNAPTALVKLYELIKDKKINPIAIIGVPVGFVNVAVAKELIMTAGVPYIVARGRKGGSGVAAAICNAVIYEIKN